MRITFEDQLRFGTIDIEQIELDVRSGDEVPTLLRGLKEMYCNDEIRNQVGKVLDKTTPKGVSDKKGRKGMTRWQILVLGTLRLDGNMDYDRLKDEVDAQHTGVVFEVI